MSIHNATLEAFSAIFIDNPIGGCVALTLFRGDVVAPDVGAPRKYCRWLNRCLRAGLVGQIGNLWKLAPQEVTQPRAKARGCEVVGTQMGDYLLTARLSTMVLKAFSFSATVFAFP